MLILQKSSRIATSASVLNQCKDVAHSEYDYEVRITTEEHILDDRGFIIDHTDVHNIVKDIFQNQMGSCEQLTIRISNALAGALKKIEVPYSVMEVCVKPVGSNAFITCLRKH